MPSIDRIDRRIAGWMRDHAIVFLRVSLAIVFIWFGGLKLFGASPANDLVTRTVYWFDPKWFIPVLGVWEVLIGVCMLWRPLIRVSIGLLTHKFIRVTLLLLWLQMLGTITPLILFPSETWLHFPIAPTLEGQYIIKNLVLISAAMAVGGTVRPRVHHPSLTENAAQRG